jgi:hypothetical protein
LYYNSTHLRSTRRYKTPMKCKRITNDSLAQPILI